MSYRELYFQLFIAVTGALAALQCGQTTRANWRRRPTWRPIFCRISPWSEGNPFFPLAFFPPLCYKE